MTQELGKTYQPREVESRWYDFWQDNDLFKADETSDKPPFCIVIPPPNVTGKLHMGHALFVTIQDILTRWKRMQGFEALWLPGTDHAGIATQVMVERQLASEGTNRHELGREKFLERVWQWKEDKGGSIIGQMKVMGASCDWERERFTMDEGLSTAVREVFVRLYEEGLIFRGERLVNWDPATQTVLSDLEVVQEEEDGSLWHLAYPIDGTDRSIVVATTRPETMLGDTAVAVHPEDERYKDVIGKFVALPLTDRLIPIIADGLVADPEFGSGAVKITPAHDFNDFDCGVRNGLERIQVIGLDANMTDAAPEKYQGMTREACRDAVVADLDAAGHLVKTVPHKFMPTRSERSGVIVEPMLLPQWWVKADVLAKPAIEAVESKKTTILPEMWEKTYFNWMHNIRDWCISRQLWWGHQIPAWYCNDCDEILASKVQGYDYNEIRIGKRAEPVVSRTAPTSCAKCNGTNLVQDPDVLDTWFSSALWPFSTMGWPEETQTLKKFYPTSVMETGFDIIFFWVARMMMMGIHFMDEIPFETVYFHALIRDKEGRKMSKTTGNVVDPLHIIYGVKPEDVPEQERAACRQLFEDYPEGVEAQGADALRFTLAMYAAQGRDIRLDLRRVEGYRAFFNKLWQATRFTMMNCEGTNATSELAENYADSVANAWIVTELQTTIQTVTNALDEYRFNEAAQTVYDFLWHAYCDWFIELSKPTLYAEDSDAEQAATRSTLLYVLENVVRLLHPFAPYVSEEIWQALPKGADAPISVSIAPWPTADEDKIHTQKAQDAQRLISIVQSLRNLRGESNVPPSKSIPELLVYSDDQSLRTLIEDNNAYILKLAKLETIAFRSMDSERPKASATTVADGVELVVALAGLIDLEEERQRVGKALKKLEKEILFVSKKLNNPRFVEKAPEEIVDKERAKLAGYEADKSKLLASLDRLADAE